jgi:hypothetical protein
MRIRSRAAALAMVVATSAVLVGCVQSPSGVIPTSEPSATPVFASDAAALAAAKKAYVAYLVVSDQVANDGGQNAGRFSAVVTRSWLPREQASAASLLQSNRSQVGASAAEKYRLEQRSQTRDIANVSVYVCLDLSAVHYVDTGSGSNPTAPTAALVPIEVNLVSAAKGSQTLLVERNTPWQGNDFCQ